MSKKEEKAKEYSFNIPSKLFNSLETNADKVLWKNDVELAFEAGWEAAVKEIKADIEWRRNESTWAEYNEALDDISSFIDSFES